MIKKIACMLICAICPLVASERYYLDIAEVTEGEDCFKIHTGSNIWIQTSSVNRDATGFFTYTGNILLASNSTEYERKWKCPYCNEYWPMGCPCGNDDCPGKY